MSRTPRRAYALSEEQHQCLSQKAVTLTQSLNQPVSCRHVLDAFLSLGLDVDESELARQLDKQLNTTRRRTRNPPRRQE